MAVVGVTALRHCRRNPATPVPHGYCEAAAESPPAATQAGLGQASRRPRKAKGHHSSPTSTPMNSSAPMAGEDEIQKTTSESSIIKFNSRNRANTTGLLKSVTQAVLGDSLDLGILGQLLLRSTHEDT
jgi:hypothetical protein